MPKIFIEVTKEQMDELWEKKLKAGCRTWPDYLLKLAGVKNE